MRQRGSCGWSRAATCTNISPRLFRSCRTRRSTKKSATRWSASPASTLNLAACASQLPVRTCCAGWVRPCCGRTMVSFRSNTGTAKRWHGRTGPARAEYSVAAEPFHPHTDNEHIALCLAEAAQLMRGARARIAQRRRHLANWKAACASCLTPAGRRRLMHLGPGIAGAIAEMLIAESGQELRRLRAGVR